MPAASPTIAPNLCQPFSYICAPVRKPARVLNATTIRLLFILGLKTYSISMEYAIAGIAVSAREKKDTPNIIIKALPTVVDSGIPKAMIIDSRNIGMDSVGISIPKTTLDFLPFGFTGLPCAGG